MDEQGYWKGEGCFHLRLKFDGGVIAVTTCLGEGGVLFVIGGEVWDSAIFGRESGTKSKFSLEFWIIYFMIDRKLKRTGTVQW